jgi:iron complex outermembrane recepter protein
VRRISGCIHDVSMALLVTTALWCSGATAQALVHFDLPEQSLALSLEAIGTATNTDVGFKSSQVAGLIAPSLKADLTVDGALVRVLAGTGLRSRRLDDHTIVITAVDSSTADSVHRKSDTQKGSAPSGQPEDPPRSMNERRNSSALRLAQEPSLPQTSNEPGAIRDQRQAMEEVVVTGTHIHDSEPVTPVITITHDDIVNQGYTTLDQVIEQLPQNFKAGASQESNPVNHIGNGASNNYSYAAGVNLRGLGANATLVLLNGRRLAPTAFGGVTDISQIPVSIIDRVEILTDGASALYGSDAVAGVVNVITKRDYSGVEVGGRINSISEGKTPNYGGNVLGGFSWDSGNLVLDFDHEKDNPLLARNRSFTETLLDPTSLLQKNETSSYYASLQNHFTDRLSLSGDVLLTHRTYDSQDRLGFDATAPRPYNAYGTTDQYSASFQLDFKLSSEWTATMVAQGSKESDSSTSVYPDPGGNIARDYPFNYQVFSIEPRVDGKLFGTPGGAARLALGGQFRRETFYDSYAVSSSLTTPLEIQSVADASRHIASVYGELLLPIVGKDNAMPFVRRLRIDISGRYDDYSDFGHTSNPKIGAEWVPLTGLAFHATYSRSFQAPTLYEASPSNATGQNFGYLNTVPDPKSPSGTSLLLGLYGTNPNLQAETSKNFKAGFTYEPEFVNGLKLDASYFSIEFKNQIAQASDEGFGTNALQEEAVLGSLVVRNPSLAQAVRALYSPGRSIANGDAGYCIVGTSGCPAVDPANLAAIVNLGYENLASVRLGGIDLTAKYIGQAPPSGSFRADLDGTFFTTYQQRITPGSTEASPLNTLYNPLRFRAKVNVGWAQGGWGVNARLNYFNAYQNTNAVNPNCPGGSGCQIASWTTVDCSLSYASPRDAESLLGGVRVALDVMNLFNRAPPLVSSPVGSGTYPYDPTNANAFLRMFGISVTKRWGGEGGH